MKTASTRAHRKWERTAPKRRIRGMDPYVAVESGPRAHCPDCGLLYRDKRWVEERRTKARAAAGKTPALLCPACRKIRDRVPSGEVVLSGPFLAAHRREIESTIRHEESRAREKNPLERIMAKDWDHDRLIIRTTVKKLAQRIGRVLHTSYKGDLVIRFGTTGTLTRVYWHREG